MPGTYTCVSEQDSGALETPAAISMGCTKEGWPELQAIGWRSLGIDSSLSMYSWLEMIPGNRLSRDSCTRLSQRGCCKGMLVQKRDDRAIRPNYDDLLQAGNCFIVQNKGTVLVKIRSR